MFIRVHGYVNTCTHLQFLTDAQSQSGRDGNIAEGCFAGFFLHFKNEHTLIIYPLSNLLSEKYEVLIYRFLITLNT